MTALSQEHTPHAYLHATDAHADGCGGRLLTLPHLSGALLLASVIPVLPRPHLQVQDTRQLKVGRQVLEKNEFWSSVKDWFV